MESAYSVLAVCGANSQFPELQPILEKFSLKVTMVNSVKDAINFIKSEAVDLILTDIQIGNVDGIELLAQLKPYKESSDFQTTVVFSERKENYVEITALNAGADDFLVKPVNRRVFESRLNAWLRHFEGRISKLKRKHGNGEVVLDEERFSVHVKNSEVVLQRKEFEIISLLISKPKKVFSRDEIKEFVWLDSEHVRNRTIDVHIRNLRSKIGSKYIKTYKGIGYSYDS